VDPPHFGEFVPSKTSFVYWNFWIEMSRTAPRNKPETEDVFNDSDLESVGGSQSLSIALGLIVDLC